MSDEYDYGWAVPINTYVGISSYGRVVWRDHGKVLVEFSQTTPPISEKWKGTTVVLLCDRDVIRHRSREEADGSTHIRVRA